MGWDVDGDWIGMRWDVEGIRTRMGWDGMGGRCVCSIRVGMLYGCRKYFENAWEELLSI